MSAESVAVCGKLHSATSGHRCFRPKGHQGYHYSRSGGIWLVKYLHYGIPDDAEFHAWQAALNDGSPDA